MGLFSKKEETINDAPPVPMAASSGAPPAPGIVPAPPAPVTMIQKPVEGSNNLSSPPVPGGTLEDIRTQVSAKSSPSVQEEDNDNEEPGQSLAPISNESNEKEDLSDDDSLFDFSELDVDSPVNTKAKLEDASVDENAGTEDEMKPEQQDNHEDVDLSFIKQRHKQTQDTYFVTTSQFKSLLEIVESVKTKVKDASETHLKLLDIKAEEDIEFENLRKDFQFIEDKLYEVDSIIFEK